EPLRHHPADQTLQLTVVPRARQARVADVEAQVEMVVVDPDRVSLERHPRDPLAVARDPVEAGREVAPDAIDVHAARRRRERPRVEHGDAAEMHVRVRVLEHEERAVLRGEPFVACGRHRVGAMSKPIAAPSPGMLDGGRRAGAVCRYVSSTARNRTAFDIILSKASGARASGKRSIIGRTPVSAANRIVSSESIALPDDQPRTLRVPWISCVGATGIGSKPAPTTISSPSRPRPSISGAIALPLGAVARMTRAPPSFRSAAAGSPARVSTYSWAPSFSASGRL